MHICITHMGHTCHFYVPVPTVLVIIAHYTKNTHTYMHVHAILGTHVARYPVLQVALAVRLGLFVRVSLVVRMGLVVQLRRVDLDLELEMYSYDYLYTTAEL